MCPSLYTSIYPSLTPTFSKTVLPVSVCVSSNCTKKERQRGRGKERDANRAARTGGHLSSRLEKKNDGLAWRSNQQRGVHAHQRTAVTQRSTHTGKLTSRYTWRGSNIRSNQTRVRPKLKNYRAICSQEMSSQKKTTAPRKKSDWKWTNLSGRSDYINQNSSRFN